MDDHDALSPASLIFRSLSADGLHSWLSFLFVDTAFAVVVDGCGVMRDNSSSHLCDMIDDCGCFFWVGLSDITFAWKEDFYQSIYLLRACNRNKRER